MHYRDSIDDSDDFYSNVGKVRKKAKEDMLDETFKKAEISIGMRPKKDPKIQKTPFLKLGIILIFVAVISIAIVMNNLPWMFIKYDAEYGTIQEFYYKDFENKENNYYEEVENIFDSSCNNCSNNSKNFVGLIKDDFTSIPKTAMFGFFGLLILGIIFTIFEVFERIQKFSRDIVTLIHSTFAAVAFIISIFITILMINFLGSYFLLYYNKGFIEASGVTDVVLIYPVSLILIVICFAIMIITTTIMKINFQEFEKKIEQVKTRAAISKFKLRNEK